MLRDLKMGTRTLKPDVHASYPGAVDVLQRKSRHAHWNQHSRNWASRMSACDFEVSRIRVSHGNPPSRRKEICDDPEDSKNHRSAGWHGNQHVRLCAAQMSVRNGSAIVGGGPASCDDAPDPGAVRTLGGHLRRFFASLIQAPG
jgi:hypothetical protein